MKVLKFGGSSLADATQILKAAAIFRSDKNNRYVVVSAPGKRSSEDTKVTDLLYQAYALSQKGEGDTGFAPVEARFNSIIANLGIHLDLSADFQQIRQSLQTTATQDFIVSRGEYFSGKIFAALLDIPFIDPAHCIAFDKNGQFVDRLSYDALRNELATIDSAVIPGFYGATSDGEIKTFSRGGSDITGAIVARAAKADVYENWTDVSGLLVADPRVVENPKEIRTISYRELRELAYMGATVMHDEAIFPVREVNIPINIRNTNDPLAPGTMIVPESYDFKSGIITGIAAQNGFASINITKSKMNNETGFGRKILSILEDFEISFEHLPTGIDTMSVIISADKIKIHEKEIIKRILQETNSDSVSVEKDLALLAVVGRGMIHALGTASRIFHALAMAQINIRLLDQGSSEENIIIGVTESDRDRAIRAIYYEFIGKGL